MPGLGGRVGCSLDFTCTGCGYTATVSGGNDAGMRVATTTIVCLDCKGLEDAAVQEMGEDPDGKWVPVPLRCSKNMRHRISLWEEGQGCPRCGEPMKKGELVALWD